MTKDEAKEQIEAFFLKLGEKVSVFDDNNFAKAQIGESFLGFEFTDEQTLSCVALIYRFRKQPKDEVLEAIEAETDSNETGGGEVKYDEFNKLLFLERIYDNKVSNEDFYAQMRKLSEASMIWSSDVLNRVGEEVNTA